MEKKKVYLDHITTTPLRKEVREAMLPFLTQEFGNPQSLHSFAEKPREAIEEARQKVANFIKAQPSEIIFTSSGTEANNFVVKGVAEAQSSKGKHIITSSIEHFSLLYPLKKLEKQGFEVTYLPVDKEGFVQPEDLKRSLRQDTILVSIMLANNEIGTIEPVEELVKVVKENSSAYFHTDAVAAGGRIEIDVQALGVDFLTLSAHLFYGPKGAGALYARQGVRIFPFIEGGIQEGGRRAGIENVPGIVGMGKAAELAQGEIKEQAKNLNLLSQELRKGLEKELDRVYFTGHPKQRLPGHLSLCVEFIEGEAMLMLLDQQGIAATSGSTCTSRALKASHVLQAIGVPTEIIQGSVVFSLGRSTTKEEIDYLLSIFPSIVNRLRQMSPLYTKFLKESEGK
jgi:cysteine desulfurase